jgi:chromosome segregation ATPase
LEELDGGIRVLIEKESEIDHDLCANIQDKMEVDSENIRDIDDETSEGLAKIFTIFQIKLFLEREQICGDLVKLEEDINIKEKLIYELKKSEQKLAKLRHTYEQRLEKMLERIQATEAERDRILSEMSSKKQEDNKVQTVREEYEKRIYSMRQDFNRIRSESSENKKMHVQQQRQRMDLEKLQGELINLKRTKVFALLFRYGIIPPFPSLFLYDDFFQFSYVRSI